MPALKPTDHTAEIVYLGVVLDRETRLGSDARADVDVRFGGVRGESHGGLTRESCVRVRAQHPPGTTIANVRQFSIVSEEEMAQIAERMGIDEVRPEWMGASIMVRGISDFTHLPPSSRLQTARGTTLVIDMENRPCKYPGIEEIEPHYPGKGAGVTAAALGRRGVTAWVEREGPLALGDTFTLHVPDQRAWRPAV
ncbi:MAG: sulfurase [Pseudomonadota bacterium]